MLTGINNAFADGIVEKIYPFGATKEYFHRYCMRILMKNAVEDIFEKIQDLHIAQKYIWVREFGSGAEREIYPMHEYGKTFFMAVNGSYVMKCEKYEEWWPTAEMIDFDSSLISGKELLAKQMSSKECKHQYSTNSDCSGYTETQNYYCLPIYEETYTYEGKKHTFLGIGNNTISTVCSSDVPNDTEVICGQPKYTSMTPVTTTAIVLAIILAVVIVIALFSQGFWSGLLWTLLIGGIISVIGAFVGAILLVPLVAMDTIIQKSVNASRRKKFRTRYEQIQRKKQQDAKRLLNLDLDFEVPEFPIP